MNLQDHRRIDCDLGYMGGWLHGGGGWGEVSGGGGPCHLYGWGHGTWGWIGGDRGVLEGLSLIGEQENFL